MTGETIRAATLRDSEAIADLHTESWRSAYRGILPDRYLDDEAPTERRNHWLAFLSDPAQQHLTLVATNEGEFQGFISVHFAADPGFDATVENLHVQPVLRGQGLGRRLLADAIAHLIEQRLGSMCLWVFDANAKAIRFYQGLGGAIDERGFDNFGGAKLPHSRVVWQDLPALLQACRT